MARPRQILLVCTGNTCRSPMAASILSAALKERGLDAYYTVTSAGTAAQTGMPATDHAVSAVARFGYSLHGHRSQLLTRELVDSSWLILTMTHDHKSMVVRQFPQAMERVYTLGEFAGGPFGPDWEVPDPFGGGAELYQSTSEQLHRVLQRIADKLGDGVSYTEGARQLKIAFGCDHAGFALREAVLAAVEEAGHTILDFGTHSTESVDYPDFGARVGRAVASGEADLGIVICGTGIGISIAANKIKGVRAALCSEPFSARMSREHNNANVLAMGARVIGPDLAKEIVRTFLNTPFSGGRHENRVQKISALEES